MGDGEGSGTNDEAGDAEGSGTREEVGDADDSRVSDEAGVADGSGRLGCDDAAAAVVGVAVAEKGEFAGDAS